MFHIKHLILTLSLLSISSTYSMEQSTDYPETEDGFIDLSQISEKYAHCSSPTPIIEENDPCNTPISRCTTPTIVPPSSDPIEIVAQAAILQHNSPVEIVAQAAILHHSSPAPRCATPALPSQPIHIPSPTVTHSLSPSISLPVYTPHAIFMSPTYHPPYAISTKYALDPEIVQMQLDPEIMQTPDNTNLVQRNNQPKDAPFVSIDITDDNNGKEKQKNDKKKCCLCCIL